MNEEIKEEIDKRNLKKAPKWSDGDGPIGMGRLYKIGDKAIDVSNVVDVSYASGKLNFTICIFGNTGGTYTGNHAVDIDADSADMFLDYVSSRRSINAARVMPQPQGDIKQPGYVLPGNANYNNLAISKAQRAASQQGEMQKKIHNDAHVGDAP